MIRTEDFLNSNIGSYQIVSFIGEGNRGKVFLAQQSNLRQVAIKLFFPKMAAESARFQQQCAHLQKIQHSHILPLHAYGIQDGLPYVVMPHVEHKTLRDYLRQKGAISPSDAFTLLDQLARALDYAHQRSIPHGYIHSGNIFLQSKDYALLADFQVEARGLEYCANDIIALGKLLYELVTGQVPGQVPIAPHTIVPTLTDEVEQVLLRAVSAEVTQYYACAQDLADEFSVAVMETLMRRSSTKEETLETSVQAPTSRPVEIPPLPDPQTATPMAAQAGPETKAPVSAPPIGVQAPTPALNVQAPIPQAPFGAQAPTPPLSAASQPPFGVQAPAPPMGAQVPMLQPSFDVQAPALPATPKKSSVLFAGIKALRLPTRKEAVANPATPSAQMDIWETITPSSTHISLLVATILIIVLLCTLGLWIIYTQAPAKNSGVIEILHLAQTTFIRAAYS